MRMSAIKHPVRSCSPEFRNSSADANAKAGKPADFIRPLSALRTSSSSSTIATTFGFSLELTMPKNSEATGITQLCFGIDALGGWCWARRSAVPTLEREPKPRKPSWPALQRSSAFQPHNGRHQTHRERFSFSHFDEFGERAGLHFKHHLSSCRAAPSSQRSSAVQVAPATAGALGSVIVPCSEVVEVCAAAPQAKCKLSNANRNDVPIFSSYVLRIVHLHRIPLNRSSVRALLRSL